MIFIFNNLFRYSTNSSEVTTRPTKRSKKSSSNDNISELNNDLISSQQDMNE